MLLEMYFILVWIILEIFTVIWMLRLKPKKNIINKYQKKIIFLAQLPFGSSWKKNILKDDIRLFENYQYRIRIWYLSVMIPFFLFFVYLFLKYL